jgi:hypothetical protein
MHPTKIKSTELSKTLIFVLFEQYCNIVAGSCGDVQKEYTLLLKIVARQRSILKLKLKPKLHGLSPRANYTDRPSDRRLSAK